jgi:TatD DNase family protein
MQTLIDTHAHLYSPKFENDRHDMVRRALEAGIVRMYLPNIAVCSPSKRHFLKIASP